MNPLPLTLSISPAGSTVAPQADAAGNDSPAGASPETSFAELLGSMRQEFAALGVPPLVSQPLGNGMTVITPNAPSPETDSLLAFARSQGLDEQAIAALWQPGVAGGSETPPSPLSPSSPTLNNSTTAAAMLMTGVTAATPGNAAPAPIPVTSLGLNGLPTVATTAIPTAPQATQVLANKPAWACVAAASVLASQAMKAANQETSEPAPSADGIDADTLPQTALTASQLLPLRESRPLKTPAPPQDAELSPPLITIQTNQKSPELPVETLDLEAELKDIVGAANLDVSAPAVPADTLAMPVPGDVEPNAEAGKAQVTPPVISGYQLKMEHYQQLADRMGQALAQRLQQQIERGEWSVRIKLNPVELGQVDVQLDMHQGGLDAMFQTDNAVTRDLILQGSGRLKEGLSQSGMTVASVMVNSDGSRQSGGNPTPQQQRRPTANARPSSPESAPAQVSGTSASSDGWDVLA